MASMKYSIEELSGKIDEFIALCDNGKIPIPEDYYLYTFLGISSATLQKYYTDGNIEDREKGENNTYKGYSQALKKIIDYRTVWLAQQAMKNPKNSFYLFALKQKHNGGWTDKQETVQSGDIKLQISLTGADGKPYKSG